jgi:hypothetical protein
MRRGITWRIFSMSNLAVDGFNTAIAVNVQRPHSMSEAFVFQGVLND